MILGKKEIMAAVDIKTQIVPVPEWGGDVYVKNLSGSEREEYESSLYVMDNGKPVVSVRSMASAKLRLCALSLCDDKGGRIFDIKEVAELGKKSSTAIDRVYDAILEVSGLSKEIVAELEKN